MNQSNMRTNRRLKAIRDKSMREQKRTYKNLLKNEMRRKLIHFSTLSTEERELYIECESNDIAIEQERINKHRILI